MEKLIPLFAALLLTGCYHAQLVAGCHARVERGYGRIGATSVVYRCGARSYRVQHGPRSLWDVQRWDKDFKMWYSVKLCRSEGEATAWVKEAKWKR